MGRGRRAKSCGWAKKLSKKREKDYSPPLKLRILRAKIKKNLLRSPFSSHFRSESNKNDRFGAQAGRKNGAFFCSKTLKTDKKNRANGRGETFKKWAGGESWARAATGEVMWHSGCTYVGIEVGAHPNLPTYLGTSRYILIDI